MRDRTVIVTGASRGLGKAMALTFAAEGACVALLYRRNRGEAQSVVERIAKKGGVARAYACNVADAEAVRRTVDEILQRAGSIEVLVNNAGVTHSSLLLKTDEAIWHEVISTNLTGAFHCTRAVVPFMFRQGKGHIVNVGSLSGMRGAAGAAAYCASKAGLIGLTLTAARECAPYNVSVNAILPGFMPTDMGSSLPRGSRDRIVSENLLGRGSTIEEIASFVVRLVQMQGVSGQVFNLDSRPWR